jgi:hypothetical protein
MSFVQRFDKRTGNWLKLDHEGYVIAEGPKAFIGPDGKPLEEIEPVEFEQPRAGVSDPLGDYR